VTFSKLDATKTLVDISSGKTAKCILVWIPLMSGADSADVVDEWIRILSGEPDPRKRSEFVVLARVFAKFVNRTIWVEKLEGYNVITSPIFDEFRAEGRKEGHKEGHKEAQREVVIKFRPGLHSFLASRFPGAVPAELTAKINEVTDFDTLNRWFQAAIAAKSIDELMQQINAKS
jgi:hypothetical protein